MEELKEKQPKPIQTDFSMVGDIENLDPCNTYDRESFVSFLERRPQDAAMQIHGQVGSGNIEEMGEIFKEIAEEFESYTYTKRFIISYRDLVKRMDRDGYPLDHVHAIVMRDFMLLLKILGENGFNMTKKKFAENLLISVNQALKPHKHFGCGHIDGLNIHAIQGLLSEEELNDLMSECSEQKFDKELFPLYT